MNLSALMPSSAFSSSVKQPGLSTAVASSFGPVLKDKLGIDSSASRLSSNNERLAGLRSLQNMLHGDQVEAAKVAKDFAYEDNTSRGIGGLLDMRGVFIPGGDGIIRYMDGSPVTAESKAYFNKEEGRFRQERIKIYESGMANGTPPADIYDKLMTAMDNQPERYRMMMNWPGSVNQA